jgi:hypothetical protein
MAEGSGNSNTAIWVAVITVAGSLLTAVIVNADKWVDRSSPPAIMASPAAAALASPNPSPLTSTAAPVTNQSGLTPQTTDPAPAAPAPEPTTFNLNGEWRDDEGGRYSFDQTGSKFELTQMSVSGNTQLFGRGTISGRDLEYSFEMMTEEKGNCSGRLNSAGNKITGNCTWPEGGWTFVIAR